MNDEEADADEQYGMLVQAVYDGDYVIDTFEGRTIHRYGYRSMLEADYFRLRDDPYGLAEAAVRPSRKK